MAEDEDKHAQWIKDLYLSEVMKKIALGEGKNKTTAISGLNNHIETIIHQAERGKASLKIAGVYALDFEGLLIEKDLFCCFKVLHDSGNRFWLKLIVIQKDTAVKFKRP